MSEIPVGDVGQALGPEHLRAHRELSRRVPALEGQLDVNALEAMKTRLDALEANPTGRRLAAVTRTTDFGHSGTGPATVVTLSFVVPANRLIRLSVSFTGANAATITDRSYLSIREGLTTHAQMNLNYSNFQSNGGSFNVTVSYSTTGTRGFNLAATGGSTGNFNLQCPTYGPLVFEAHDVGPTP